MPSHWAHPFDWGVFEHSRSPCHNLCIAHGLTLVTSNLNGWEAFPMPRALTHTKITWALSPTPAQVSGVTRRSPLYPWCFGHSSSRGARQTCHVRLHLIPIWSKRKPPFIWRWSPWIYCMFARPGSRENHKEQQPSDIEFKYDNEYKNSHNDAKISLTHYEQMNRKIMHHSPRPL